MADVKQNPWSAWSAPRDFIDASREWRIWSQLGWQDLLNRYRRSWAGPLWIIISALIFIGALSVVYSAIFNQKITEYVIIVAIGVPIWNFVSGVVGESVGVFVESETYIKQTRLNFFIYILRTIWRNFLVFLNQFVVSFLIVLFIGNIEFGSIPLVLIGIILMILQAIWIVPLLGVLGSRYRDLQPLIQNILLILFLTTPILWVPSLLGTRRFIADFNPLAHVIEVIRAPMLGQSPSFANYAVVISMAVLGGIVSALLYGRFKNRIVYWL
jgi:ABC-type polysaccharide/polyol phosphate export permease